MENKKGQGFSKKVGDTIERVGQKISDAGAHKVGDAVFNAGDKLEHSDENKKQPSTTNINKSNKL